jgi:Xaa-Pro aminopeptidase
VPDVLLYGDSVRSPEMRHEVPLGIPDPFLYAETNGSRHVVIHAMEAARMGDLGLQLHPYEEFGYDELVRSGMKADEIRLTLLARACRELGIESAVVPTTFPLEVADHLRAEGVELASDRELFRHRRRAKNEAELEGVRRAQRAADAGMGVARDMLRRARIEGSTLTLDGEVLTSERVTQAIMAEFSARDCTADDMIVAPGWQGAVGHHAGEGPIGPGQPLVVDIWPRDRRSGCYADMTRTFVVGEVPDDVRAWHRLCVQALDDALEATHPGASGRAIYDATCDLFERHGEPTGRTKEPGKPLADGFFHGLGHGVGLEVHEAPNLGLTSRDELIPGDVITLEPGLYRQGYGGVRVEDLVLVTEDGRENLTDFPYELEPDA